MQGRLEPRHKRNRSKPPFDVFIYLSIGAHNQHIYNGCATQRVNPKGGACKIDTENREKWVDDCLKRGVVSYDGEEVRAARRVASRRRAANCAHKKTKKTVKGARHMKESICAVSYCRSVTQFGKGIARTKVPQSLGTCASLAAPLAVVATAAATSSAVAPAPPPLSLSPTPLPPTPRHEPLGLSIAAS